MAELKINAADIAEVLRRNLENFTPGVMARLKLTYEELKKIRPDIIMASSSIYGQTGPKARLSGFGNTHLE